MFERLFFLALKLAMSARVFIGCALQSAKALLVSDTAHYRFSLTFRGRWGSRFKNPQTEQIEPCSTVAAALDQLEPTWLPSTGPVL